MAAAIYFDVRSSEFDDDANERTIEFTWLASGPEFNPPFKRRSHRGRANIAPNDTPTEVRLKIVNSIIARANRVGVVLAPADVGSVYLL